MGKTKVLDNGFIELIDHMGSDSRVCEAARVSVKESKSRSDDKNLIRYMMRHRHTSPFEKVVFEFHVKCPIFVMREWIRHRTGCLSGDMMLNFGLPSGSPYKKYSMSVENFYNKWTTITHNKRTDKQKDSHYRQHILSKMKLRSLNEQTGEIYHTNVVDIWSTGKQEVFTLVLEEGSQIRMTNSHQILTDTGWTTLGQAIKERGNNFLLTKITTISNKKEHCRAGVKHIRVLDIYSSGIEETFDLEVSGPDHNFSVNDIIVHNSFNELSARYSQLPNEFYLPKNLRKQSSSNHQGSSAETIEYNELVHKNDVYNRAFDGPELAVAYDTAYKLYEELLANGVAREQARMILPVGIYTEFYWTVNMWNLMHFLKLRMDESAQWEIRQSTN